MILIILYLIILIGFLAGKDGISYSLKDKKDNSLTKGRIKRWHRDGTILMSVGTISTFMRFSGFFHIEISPLWWQIIIEAILIRTSIFDPLFNRWAQLNPTYLGGTAWSDRLSTTIFGINGAIKKAIFFGILAIIFTLLKVIFQF